MKVSVHIITYNQAKYIAQAIESALAQKTNFKIEIVIGDDFSTDGTREIIIEYAKKYPDKIRALLYPHNLGPIGLEGKNNFVQTLLACKGDYIALLEGDDYWTDVNKLQKQVELLDAHPGFVMCFHNGDLINEESISLTENTLREYELSDSLLPVYKQKDLNLEEVFRIFNPPTLTVLFRNHLIKEIPKQFMRVKNGDLFLTCLLLQYGDAAYINEKMAAYRIHDKGVWSTKSREFQTRNALFTYTELLSYFGKPYYSTLIGIINNYYVDLMNLYITHKKVNSFFMCYFSSIWFNGKSGNWRWIKECILFFTLFFKMLFNPNHH